MDEQNVHHFWGISPALDVQVLLGVGVPKDEPSRLLMVCPYDARHILQTICHSRRHPEGEVELHVYEDNAAALARHMILLAIFLDNNLEVNVRMRRFLEIFGNALLREDTADYLSTKCKVLEIMLEQMLGGAEVTDQTLARLIDIKNLSFEAKDALTEALTGAAKGSTYNMAKAWESRCRLWYGQRYDFRRNIVDWDYHMRLVHVGIPGCDSPGSIIHFCHFRHWRLTGIAYEVRGSSYTAPNWTLLSLATGRTREFKDRNGKDCGRSVSAKGLWCDILCSPYHSFGTLCEDEGYYKVANKEFRYTAIDISERNILALMHELEVEKVKPKGGDGDRLHRAAAARGPTDAQGMAEAFGPKKDAAEGCELRECSGDKDKTSSCARKDAELECTASSSSSAHVKELQPVNPNICNPRAPGGPVELCGPQQGALQTALNDRQAGPTEPDRETGDSQRCNDAALARALSEPLKMREATDNEDESNDGKAKAESAPHKSGSDTTDSDLRASQADGPNERTASAQGCHAAAAGVGKRSATELEQQQFAAAQDRRDNGPLEGSVDVNNLQPEHGSLHENEGTSKVEELELQELKPGIGDPIMPPEQIAEANESDAQQLGSSQEGRTTEEPQVEAQQLGSCQKGTTTGEPQVETQEIASEVSASIEHDALPEQQKEEAAIWNRADEVNGSAAHEHGKAAEAETVDVKLGTPKQGRGCKAGKEPIVMMVPQSKRPAADGCESVTVPERNMATDPGDQAVSDAAIQDSLADILPSSAPDSSGHAPADKNDNVSSSSANHPTQQGPAKMDAVTVRSEALDSDKDRAHENEASLTGADSGAACEGELSEGPGSDKHTAPDTIELAHLQLRQPCTTTSHASADTSIHGTRDIQGFDDGVREDCDLFDASPAKFQASEHSTSPEEKGLSQLALDTLARFKVVLHTGDLKKQLTGRKKFANAFGAVTIGNRHVHHLKSASHLAAVVKPGALVAVESARNLVQLKAEHVAKFEQTVREWATDGGFCPSGKVSLPKGHLCFELPNDEAFLTGG